MDRPVKPPGKLAAALAAATLLPGPAGAQDPAPPPREAVRVAPPEAREERSVIIKREIRAKLDAQAAPDAKVAAQQPPAPLLIPGAGVVLPNRDEAYREGLKQLRPVLATELRLLTSAAGPTPSQRREIAIEAGRSLKAHVANLANNQFNQPSRMAGALSNPHGLVQAHLEAAAWPRLSNVQSARYQAELHEKERARRDVVVLNVVAGIDRHLHLDQNQREKLCESLRSHWDDRDYPMSETTIPYDAYIPSIPNQAILFILSEDQRRVWRGLRKVHLSAISVANPVETLLKVDLGEDDPDEDVIAALGGEVKK